jgi:hypothetical protein
MFNKSLRRIFLSLIVAACVVSTCAAQAANDSLTASSDNPKLKAALAEVEQKKAEARAQRSEALARDLTPLEKDWGIKLYGIRYTAAGYMLEMKYRVLDPQKAFPLLKTDVKRYVIVKKSGAVLEVPFTEKLGSLRSSVRSSNMVKKDHDYVAFFANPGKHVDPGDKVTLVIGNFMAENLPVQ